MNMPLAQVDRMQIAGYIPLTTRGFALPAYRDVARRGNAWYCAQPEIDGDREAPIAWFDVLEDEVDHTINHPAEISIGDAWHDVFLWRELAVAGTPQQIFDSLSDHHEEIRSAAPLSFLDLSLAVRDPATPELARIALEFMRGRLGDAAGAINFREVVIRSGVAVQLRRHLRRHLPDYAAHESELDFTIRETKANNFLVDLTPDTSVVLGAEHALHHLKGGIAKFGEKIGVELDLADFRNVPSSDVIEAPSLDPPEIETGRQAEGPAQSRRRRRLFGLAQEIAIDLGTSHTRIYASGRGTILAEPSAVAVNTRTGVMRVAAVGSDAKLMAGKTPDDIEVLYPLRDGVIVDTDVAVAMLREFITKVYGKRRFGRPLDVILCIPSCSTESERRALREAAAEAGASRVTFVEALVATAIGAGLPITQPIGSMIVNLGGGVTQLAVIALGAVVYETSYRVGGDRMDEAIISYIRRNHSLVVGYSTAERLKKEIGTARPPADGIGRVGLVRGLCLINSVPKEIEFDQREVADALSEPVAAILEAARITLRDVPPELAADVFDNGMTLAGGGALLDGLDAALSEETGLRVFVAEDPQNCVTRGLVRILEDETLRGVLRPA